MRMIVKKQIDSKGMTLIEILLSLTILSFVLLTFASFFSQSARTNQQAEAITDATFVAQTFIEEATNTSGIITNWQLAVKQISQNLGFPEPASPVDGKYTIAGPYQAYYVEMQIFGPQQNGKTTVKVYDQTKTKMEAHMETRLLWEE